MPAYNAANYIQETIESVLSQDYEEFELLIIDDCSKDKTWDIMQKYKRHLRVRLSRNKINFGVGKTRNKLVGLALGEYITPCDADDIMLQGNLKRHSIFLDNNPKYGAVYSDMLVLEINNNNVMKRPPYIAELEKDLEWDLVQNLVNHAGSMIRKDLIRKVNGYNETVYSIDDWDLWLKLAEITKIKYLQGEIYYVWRKHPKGLTRTDKKWKQDYIIIMKEAVKRRYGLGSIS